MLRVGDRITFHSSRDGNLDGLVMEVLNDAEGALPRAISVEVRYPFGIVSHAMTYEGERDQCWTAADTRMGTCAVCEQRYALRRDGRVPGHYRPGNYTMGELVAMTTNERIALLCPGGSHFPLAD